MSTNPYRTPSPPSAPGDVPLWPLLKHVLAVLRYSFLRWAVRKMPKRMMWQFHRYQWFRVAWGGHWERWNFSMNLIGHGILWFPIDRCTGISGRAFPGTFGRGLCEVWTEPPPGNLPECATSPTPHRIPCQACEVLGTPDGEPHTLECQYSCCHICGANFGQPCDEGLHS